MPYLLPRYQFDFLLSGSTQKGVVNMPWWGYVLIAIAVVIIGQLKLMTWKKMKQKASRKKLDQDD
jgi:hypothetical protein